VGFRFEWRKNGQPLGNRFNVQYRLEGVVTINPLSMLDAGHYQCYASNMYGTAVSTNTVLQQAVIGSYPSTEPLELTATEGSPFTIRCQPVKCYPQPAYSWALERGRTDDSMQSVISGNRVQIDDQGWFYT